jgi:hypothetical protein
VFFFFKKPKVVVDCFTNDETTYKFSRIDDATKFYPDWWKALPNEKDDGLTKRSTMKRCQGFIDYYTHGFIVPLWSDLNLKVEDNNTITWIFADGKSVAAGHSLEQVGDYVDKNKVSQLKLKTPWHLKSKEYVPFVWMQPYWNYQPFDNISIPPAVVDFKYQHGTHINMFLKVEKGARIELKHGLPMAHMIPMTEKEVELKHHLVDDKEFNSYIQDIKFTHNYKHRKELIDTKEKKCPFH